MAQYSNKLYYNINIAYDETKPCDACVASIQYDSGEPILANASDYYVSIINFSLPVSSVPLTFIDIQDYPNVDVNATVHKVALEYNSEVITKTVMFYPSDLLYSPPAAPTAAKPKVERTLYHASYTYDHFLDMINIALKSAYDDLAAKPGGSAEPKVTFNPTSNLFSIVADATYANSGTPIKIYFNFKLFQYFLGFNVTRVNHNASDARDFRFEFLDSTGTVTQNYSTVSSWNCLRTLQLKSPLLMSRSEYVPATGCVSSSNDATQPVLASFNPIPSNSAGNSVPRSQIVFTLNSAHRLIDLISTQPLTKISLLIDWCDDRNLCWPLILNPRDLVQCKLCFHRKDSYAG